MRVPAGLFASVTYPDAKPGMDLTYEIGPEGIRETYTVESEAALLSLGDLEVTVECEGVEPKAEGSTVAFVNETGEEIFAVKAPLMEDAAGEVSTEIEVRLEAETEEKTAVTEEEADTAALALGAVPGEEAAETRDAAEEAVQPEAEREPSGENKAKAGTPEENGAAGSDGESGSNTETDTDIDTEANTDTNTETNTATDAGTAAQAYRYTLVPDAAWLADADRTYPVTIDPDLTTSIRMDYIDDTYVNSGTPDTANGYGQARMKVGYGSSSRINRSYIRFRSLPKLSPGDVVIQADLNLFRYYDANTTSISYGHELDLHAVTEDWSEASMTWNRKAAYNTRVESTSISGNFLKDNSLLLNRFDITRLVKQ